MKIVSRLLLIVSVMVLGNIPLGNIAYATDSENSNYVITQDSSSKDIRKIQSIFQRIGVYTGKIDGKYSSINSKIIDFQKEYSIINSEDDLKAGKLDARLLKNIVKKHIAASKKKEDINNIVPNTKFTVTAYYSPLPGQKKYSTGTYWGDIRLNGNGTHGASGAAVHEGFLAAPKNYPFGTKIYIDGIGVGIVEDRGGAIVNAGNRGHSYDRIDVWMGYGDAGLARALAWGKRTVDGKILGDDAEMITNFKDSKAAQYYDLKVNPDSGSDDVKRLQTLLKEIDFYNGSIDGKYKNVETALIAYQKQKGIIIDKESWGAGYFGAKTFTAIQKDLNGALASSSSEPVASIQESDAFSNVSRKDKTAMKKKSVTIKSELKLKAKGNTLVLNTYTAKIKKKLELAILQARTNNEKEKLRYLISLL